MSNFQASNKPKHTSKKDKNKHRKSKPSKHFVGTGQAAPKHSSGKKRFVQQSEEDRALFGPREIVSNAQKYEQEYEPENEQEEFKKRTVATLLQDQSAGVSFYRKAWEQEWDKQELEEDHIFSIDVFDLEKQLNTLSVQERLRIDANILEPIMRINNFVSKTKTPKARQVEATNNAPAAVQTPVTQAEEVRQQQDDAIPEEDELDAVLNMTEATSKPTTTSIPVQHHVSQPAEQTKDENLDSWLDEIL